MLEWQFYIIYSLLASAVSIAIVLGALTLENWFRRKGDKLKWTPPSCFW